MSAEFREILVPLDGSPESESVLAAAQPLMRGARVTLLGVVDIEAPFSAIPGLERVAEQLESAGIETQVSSRTGFAADEILSFARKQNVDLIAMSTHGRSGFRRLMMGSVTEQVLRHSEFPMLIHRPGAAVRPWKKIVVALDGSPNAESVLPEAAELARRHGSLLDVVKVALPLVTAAGVGEMGVMIPYEDPMPYLRGVCERLEATERVTARPLGREGLAASEVLRAVEESAAGLICMTTHGRTGLSRLLLGSIAEEILRHAPCPVFVRRAVPAVEPARVS